MAKVLKSSIQHVKNTSNTMKQPTDIQRPTGTGTTSGFSKAPSGGSSISKPTGGGMTNAPQAPQANNYLQQAKDYANKYGINSTLFNQIQDAAETNRQMFTPTSQKQDVYNALQNYFKQATIDKANSGTILDKANPWKNNIYMNQLFSNTNSNMNNQFGSLTDLINKNQETNTGRFDKLDEVTNKIDTGLDKYYDVFDQFQIKNFEQHDSQLKYLADYYAQLQAIQGAIGQGQTGGGAPTTGGAPSGNLGHVYAPGSSSGAGGYTENQLITNDALNRYLENIFNGGF